MWLDCILSGAETIRGISQDVGAPVRRNPACYNRLESQVLVAAPDQFNPHQIPTLPPFNVIHRRRSRDILLLWTILPFQQFSQNFVLKFSRPPGNPSTLVNNLSTDCSANWLKSCFRGQRQPAEEIEDVRGQLFGEEAIIRLPSTICITSVTELCFTLSGWFSGLCVRFCYFRQLFNNWGSSCEWVKKKSWKFSDNLWCFSMRWHSAAKRLDSSGEDNFADYR